MTTVLRPYQVDAVAQIRAHAARKGRGIILQMPTGSGKTACFADVLGGAYAKGKTALMVVRGKALVHQASMRLLREGIPHGIYQGGRTAGVHERILLCSVDTMFRRQVAPQADLIVIDECHLSHSESYKWFLTHENYAKTFMLGVSATPHHKQGMRHIADKIIMPIGIGDLIAQGYLVGARYFVPYTPDLRGVKKSAGDFNIKDLSKRSVEDVELTASAAKVWDKNLRGKSTLVYATSLEHATCLSTALEAVGCRIGSITASTADGDRTEAIAALEGGALDAIVSIGVLTTGVDIPPLQAIMCCRPTTSYNLWIQILGRGTRPFPGKKDFVVYDLSGNLVKHGPIEAEIQGDLDIMPVTAKVRMVRCASCGAFVPPPDDDLCPECGEVLDDEVDRKPPEVNSSGLAANDAIIEHVVEPWEIELPKLIAEAKKKLYKKGWVIYRIRDKYGEEAAGKAWPRLKFLRQWPVAAPADTPR